MEINRAVAEQTVSRVRQVLTRQATESGETASQALSPDGLAGWCELSEAVAYHDLKSQGAGAGQLHSNQLEELIGGWRHAFLVVTGPVGPPLLIDPTFGQFFSDGRLGEPGRRMQATPEGTSVASQLLRDGFLPWTADNAAHYETAFTGKPATAEFYAQSLRSERPMRYSPQLFASLLQDQV